MGLCIICGKRAPVRKLPHGKISIHPGECFKEFCALTQEAVPLVWFDKDSIIEREHFTKEELEGKNIELVDGAQEAENYIWDDVFCEIFSDAIKQGAIAIERAIIRNTKFEDLPLLIGKLKFPANNTNYLTERLNKEQP